MLTRLFIQNLATVKKQVIEFGNGFIALTGETGAGKSIIIKSINLILGEKCSKDLIRAGEKSLSVEAVFKIKNNTPVIEILKSLDIEHDGDITIRRKVHGSGKNSVFINDYSLKLNSLARLGPLLVDIHGQHSQQALLQTATHVDYLDQFAGSRDQVKEFQLKYQSLALKKKQKKELEQDASDRTRKVDFIQFQIDEIEKANFTPDEEHELNTEFNLLNNSEQIIETLSPIAEWTSQPDSPLNRMSVDIHPLAGIESISPPLQNAIKEIQSGMITLQEATVDINQYLDTLEVNPAKLEQINDRLSELDKLKRKYGSTIEEIDTFRQNQLEELERLENLEINFKDLEKEIAELDTELQNLASTISKQRLSKQPEFEKHVLDNLKELGLERSLFAVSIKPLPVSENSKQTFTAKGMDQVEFLITTNPGNPLKPLAKVASGGEISRIMLAIKTTLNEDISLGTMVFDEIDSGISGQVAEIVGYKLNELGNQRQIICITHSPQIASKAHSHFKVAKSFEDNSSYTEISKLSQKGRTEEIARFLGGNKITQKTLAVANDLITNKR